MSSPTNRVGQPPWTNSPALGGQYVYLPQTDQIALKNGIRYARPLHIKVESLDAARYDGILPLEYSGTPPGDGGNYMLARSRAFSAPASHGSSLPTGKALHIRDYQGTTPSGSPAAAHHIDSAMGPMMQVPGSDGEPTKSTQHILTPGGSLPTPFQRVQDLVAPKQPVYPGKSVRAVSTGSEQKLLPLFPGPTYSHVERNSGLSALQKSIQIVNRDDRSSTAQTRPGTAQDRGQKGPVQLPRSSQDVYVHVTTPSASQTQQWNSAPAPGSPVQILPIGNNGVLETMFPGFAARQRGSGDVGRLVLVLCKGPVEGSSVAPMWQPGITLSQAGGRVVAPVERYVIIDSGPPDQPYCIGLPIKTYGGRGVGVPGITKSHHCIIYSSLQPPAPMERERTVRDEDGLRRPPIRVTLDNPRILADRLDLASRVHLMGAVAIEDDNMTRNFGRVSGQSGRDLIAHFWALWTRNRPLPRPPSPEPEEESDEDEEEEEEEEGDEEEVTG